ncbi:MAG: methionine--tRNA ligase subunit beta [Acidobacteriota bacterium]
MDETKPETAEIQPAPEPKRISFDKFLQTELRVARVVEAARIEGTDRLLRLKLDVGELGPRQIVAGIAETYEPEQLVGKKIVIVANLKPARIRGVESQGMLLAADSDGRPIVATFGEDVAAGTRVR